MPDISMCRNKECKFREECYRAKAKPNEYAQTYQSFKCKDKEGEDSYFWEIKPVRKQRTSK